MHGLAFEAPRERFELGLAISSAVVRGRAAAYPPQQLSLLFQLAHFQVIEARCRAVRPVGPDSARLEFGPGVAKEVFISHASLSRTLSSEPMYVLLVARVSERSEGGGRAPKRIIRSVLLANGAVDVAPLLQHTGFVSQALPLLDEAATHTAALSLRLRLRSLDYALRGHRAHRVAGDGPETPAREHAALAAAARSPPHHRARAPGADRTLVEDQCRRASDALRRHLVELAARAGPSQPAPAPAPVPPDERLPDDVRDARFLLDAVARGPGRELEELLDRANAHAAELLGSAAAEERAAALPPAGPGDGQSPPSPSPSTPRRARAGWGAARGLGDGVYRGALVELGDEGGWAGEGLLSAGRGADKPGSALAMDAARAAQVVGGAQRPGGELDRASMQVTGGDLSLERSVSVPTADEEDRASAAARTPQRPRPRARPPAPWAVGRGRRRGRGGGRNKVQGPARGEDDARVERARELERLWRDGELLPAGSAFAPGNPRGFGGGERLGRVAFVPG